MSPARRRGLVALGAMVSIGALVLIGGLTGGSGHGGHGTSVHIPPQRVAPETPNPKPAAAPVGPADVASNFATSFEASAWNEPEDELAVRTRPWSTPSLAAVLATPNGGGPPAAYVASRSVTTAVVLSTRVDKDGPTDDLALVSLRLTTVSSDAAPSSSQVLLPLSLSLVGGRWEVNAVPGLVQ